MARLENKVAIITGGSAGIGRASAVLFAKEGAKVVVADCNVKAGEDSARMIREKGGDAMFVKTDVSSTNDVERLIAETARTYGKVNILVNNAAILKEEGSIADCTEDVFNEIVTVNFRSVWLGMKYAIPEMLKSGGGSVVNIASIGAIEGFPGLGIYSACKGAVISLSRVAAMEYAARNIRVNCVLPGVIATDMLFNLSSPRAVERLKKVTPIQRLGKPEEVAQAILFLASDDSSWTTGHVVISDGGISALHP
jgi:NAD(P)-dependent dehydrogenase (short-subunit alcohol dehydrogenase family)